MKKLVVLAVAMGVVVTLGRGYTYGEGNQLEQIPLITRYINPSYYGRDMQVVEGMGYTPRWFYVRLMGEIAKVTTLEVAFLGMTLGATTMVCGASLYLANKWLKTDLSDAWLAVVSVVVLQSVVIGGAAEVVSEGLVPHTLAVAMVVVGMVCMWEGRLVVGSVLAAMAGLIHPQVGLLSGGVMVMVSTVVDKKWWVGGVGLLILVGGAAVWWPVVGQNTMSDGDFFATLVDWRAPHHYLPSTWPFEHWRDLGVLVVGVVVSVWVAFDQAWIGKKEVHKLLGVMGLVGTGFLLAWVGSGPLQIRWLVVLQLFRLVFVVKWLGLVWLGVFWVKISHKWGLAGVIVGVMIFMTQARDWREAVVWWGMMVGGWVWKRGDMRWGVVMAGVVVGWMGWPVWQPKLNLAHGQGFEADIARFARAQTPGDSLFLTPLEMGSQFRLVAQRSIVVDWKSDPLVDSVREVWKKRIWTIYGQDKNNFDQVYKDMGITKLKKLQAEYGIDYAVMFADFNVGHLEVVYKNDKFSLVKLE